MSDRAWKAVEAAAPSTSAAVVLWYASAAYRCHVIGGRTAVGLFGPICVVQRW